MKNKHLLLACIFGSIILLILLTKPRRVIWQDYTQAWSWIVSVTWLIWIVIITRQVLLWIRPLFIRLIPETNRLNKIHTKLAIWTSMSFIFHPLAVLIVYGIWLSLVHILMSISLATMLAYRISKKILTLPWSTWWHIWLYPVYFWLWWHAWIHWTLLTTTLWLQFYWLVLWIVLITSSCYKIFTKQDKIIHFMPIKALSSY